MTPVKAVLLDRATGDLSLDEVADPQIGARDVLVRVRAAGLNRADLLARSGVYTPVDTPIGLEPIVAGLEFAGEVADVGRDVDDLSPGDRVMAMGPGHAEYVSVPREFLLPVPATYSWADAGASPVGLLTAHDALVTRGRAGPGTSVLIHGISTGVGVAALALSRVIGCDPILGTSRTPAKFERLGTGFVPIDTGSGPFEAVVLDVTEDAGVDVILDTIGGAALSSNVAAAAITARIVQIGRLGGATAELDLEEVARKRIELIGVTFRTRTQHERAAIVAACLEQVGGALAEGRLTPIVEATFSLDEVEAAHAALARNEHVGKLVLTINALP